jgi:hypothetical protein
MQQYQFYWSSRSAQHVSGKLLPIFRRARFRCFYNIWYNVLLMWYAGFPSSLQEPVKQPHSYCTHSAKQHARKTCIPHQQDIIPYVVKTSQSCAPEDGQNLARNMLSWSWWSIKLLLLHLVGVPYLPTNCHSLYIPPSRKMSAGWEVNVNVTSLSCTMVLFWQIDRR